MPVVVCITNIPAPYRERVHELVSDYFNGEYSVIYCAELEPNRRWKFTYGNYKKTFLALKSKVYMHSNVSVWNKLNEIDPDVVITTGFYPTMLYAFAWNYINKKKHISFTDGTLCSERNLSPIHVFLRKKIYAVTHAFIGPSIASTEKYISYGIPVKKIFRSNLCIDNNIFFKTPVGEKEYDLMFSGLLIERKMPLFFVEVANKIKMKTGKCKVLILGFGALQQEIEALLNSYNLSYSMPGFIDQDQLPQYYTKAKIFLLPTSNDPWGIVANEAMASGVPVITCDNAGVSGDLVVNGENGYVLPLDESIWANHIIRLLNDPDLYEKFSKNALKKVQNYKFDNAAGGIIESIKFVLNDMSA